jgi:hypothetical protein
VSQSPIDFGVSHSTLAVFRVSMRKAAATLVRRNTRITSIAQRPHQIASQRETPQRESQVV